jgi:AcrR family transcriptional regulator
VATKSRRDEATEATRVALIDAARELFAARGYGQVSTEEIVGQARVSRGALYHHFRDKRDLFRAVFKQVDRELVARVLDTDIDDPWERFTARWQAFLDACLSDSAVQRIVFVDAPAVLGWAEWRKLDAGYALGAVSAALEEAMSAGLIERRPVEPLAHIILGAMNEAGMMIANAKDAGRARADVEDTLHYVFARLRDD